jgi:hypothetical protein
MTPLRVYVKAPGHLSRAMFRVVRALTRFAPPEIVVTEDLASADVHVLHVIGPDALSYESPASQIVTIQYCWKSAGGSPAQWQEFWKRNVFTWSYYDLPCKNLYLAPLGVDDKFKNFDSLLMRGKGVVTTGYVHGDCAEAIEEVAFAAERLFMPVVHIGPFPVGMTRTPANWRSRLDVTDDELASVYTNATWVSGLRHVEGFELPALEGLVCGARPILFDRPEMRRWYDGHAVFVEECSGAPLVEQLVDVLRARPPSVTESERLDVLAKFDWRPIVEGFWQKLLTLTWGGVDEPQTLTLGR